MGKKKSSNRKRRQNTLIGNIFYDGGTPQLMGGISSAVGSFMGGLDINGSKTNQLSTDEAIDIAINGDSSQDPTARLVNDLTGWSTNAATNKIREDAYKYNIEASNNKDLIDSWDNMGLLPSQTIKGNFGTGLVDNLSAGIQGAQHGFNTGGPWGALIGAVVGQVANGISLGTRKNRVAKINEAINKANQQRLATFSNKAASINADNAMNAMLGYYKDGGQIHIDSSKRGTFTAAANKHGKSVQAFARQVLANKDNYSPAMIKKANFARNAAKWKHGDGGELDTSRVDFSKYKPLYNREFIPENMEQLQDSLISRGYNKAQRAAFLANILHETGGDPEAIDETGDFKGILQWGEGRYPNTKDLGEQIHYLMEEVKVPKSPAWSDGGGGEPYIRTLKEGYDSFMTSDNPFDATMYLSKGYVRPAEEAARKNRAREAVNLYNNMKADGGLLEEIGSNGITEINNGGIHEINPNGGVQIGIDDQGIPNLVEEGEVIYDDYVFSDRLKLDKKLSSSLNIPIKKNTTFAKAAKKLQKESEERPNDPISKRGLEDSMLKLEIAQEMVRKKKNKDKDSLVNVYEDGSRLTTKEKNLSKLRYAPAIGSGLAVLSDAFGITNTPDYYNADLIGRAVDNIKDVSYTPIGSYLRYTPMDRDYYTNKLRSMAAANRRAILNASPSRGAAIAGLLASDYNTMSKLGDLAIQADNYNQTLREKVATYNRATDAMNSEMALKAAMANTAQDKLRLYGRSIQADLRDQVDNLTSQAKSANLTNFYDNLGSIGKEQASRNMIKTFPNLLYWVDSEGAGHYMGDSREISSEAPIRSLGGYLTVKDKRKKHGK